MPVGQRTKREVIKRILTDFSDGRLRRYAEYGPVLVDGPQLVPRPPHAEMNRIDRRWSRITEAERAYLAGILDGEGCFTIGRCRTSYVPRIIVVNTNKELITWLQRNFGGDYSRSSVKGRPTWKPRYSWRVSHRSAFQVAELAHDFMRVKRKQARLFIMWSVVGEVYPKWPGLRHKFYMDIWRMIRRMNRKGVPEDAVAAA